MLSLSNSPHGRLRSARVAAVAVLGFLLGLLVAVLDPVQPAHADNVQFKNTPGGGGAGMSIGGAVTAGTTGSVLFVGPGPVLAQDNPSLFWDDTNNRLGVLTTSPDFPIHAKKSVPAADVTIGSENLSTTGYGQGFVGAPNVGFSFSAWGAASIHPGQVRVRGDFGGLTSVRYQTTLTAPLVFEYDDGVSTREFAQMNDGVTGIILNNGALDRDFLVKGSSNTLLYGDASTGNVSIKTATAGSPLTLGVDGTAALPAFSIGATADPDTGIWHPAANTWAVSTGGVEALRLDSAQGAQFPGIISNSGSGTCNGGLAGALCIGDVDTAFSNTGASSNVTVWSTAATDNSGNVNILGNGTGQAAISLCSGTPSAPTYVAQFAYLPGSADADYTDKLSVIAISKLTAFIRTDDVAAATIGWEFRDNTTGTGVQLVGVYGDGHLKHNTAEVVLPIYLGVAGAVMPLVAGGIFSAGVLAQAYTLKKAKKYARSGNRGPGSSPWPVRRT